MSRNWIIALGTLSWAAVAVDLFGHTASGDWMAAVVAGMGLATWIVVRRTRLGLVAAR